MVNVGVSQSSLSYYHRPLPTPLVYMSVPDKMREWVRSQPDKEAIVMRFPDQERQVLTYSQLNQKATHLALQLVHRGVKVGDKVAIYVHNSLEWPVADFGVMYAGATAVNIMSYKDAGFLDLVASLTCSAFILDIRHVLSKQEFSKLHEAFACNFDITKILIQGDNTLDNCIDFHDELNRPTPDGAKLPCVIDPDTHCLMWPTSGSTGMSKYIPYTHVQLINIFNTLALALRLENKDIFFQERPMGYCIGFPVSLLSRGATTIHVDANLSVSLEMADFITDVMKEEAVTAAWVPSYLLLDMERLSKEGKTLPCLRSGGIGGQKLDKSAKSAFKRFGNNLYFGYGMTEALICSKVSYEDVHWNDETIGMYIVPGVEVKLIGDDGLPVRFGEDGEICMRGQCVSREYLYEDGSVAPARDGADWIHSGDIGVLQPDGYLTVKGRTKEIIKRATVKIMPSSIEEVLKKHPSVEDAIAVGVPHIRLYEQICVFVIPKPGHSITQEELRSYAEDRFQPSLAPDGIGLMPDYFMVMDTLPHLPSSKPDRMALRKKAVDDIKSGK